MSNGEFETAFIIDDEGKMLELVGDILTTLYGIKIETFGNPEWALGRMGIVYPNIKPGEIYIPDLIVTDFDFKHPSINGLSFIRQVRVHQRNLPIILMSGDLGSGFIQREIPVLNIAATIQKPFKIANLREAVESAATWKQNHP